MAGHHWLGSHWAEALAIARHFVSTTPPNRVVVAGESPVWSDFTWWWKRNESDWLLGEGAPCRAAFAGFCAQEDRWAQSLTQAGSSREPLSLSGLKGPGKGDVEVHSHWYPVTLRRSCQGYLETEIFIYVF